MIIVDNETKFSDILSNLNKESFKDIFLLVDLYYSESFIDSKHIDYAKNKYHINMSYDTDSNEFKVHTNASRNRICKIKIILGENKYLKHYRKFINSEIDKEKMDDLILDQMIKDVTRNINKQLISEIKREYNENDIFDYYIKKEISYSELMAVGSKKLSKSICLKLDVARRHFKTAYPETINLVADIVDNDLIKEIYDINTSYGIDLILEKYDTKQIYNESKKIFGLNNDLLNKFASNYGSLDEIIERFNYLYNSDEKIYKNNDFKIYENVKTLLYSYVRHSSYIRQHIKNDYTNNELFVLIKKRKD